MNGNQLTVKKKRPLYVRLYEELREKIQSGVLAGGERLASIREMSAQAEISRSTVELAYSQLLIEGYIISKPQSGYYVCENVRPAVQPERAAEHKEIAKRQYKYNLTSSSIDRNAVDSERWKRHLRVVLSHEEVTASYGDPQGEPELRRQLALYAERLRAISVHPDNIIVGAGVQPLLCLLCGIMKEAENVAMLTDFVKAERIFRDYRINTYRAEIDDIGNADMLFVDPSDWKDGMPMPAADRAKLLNWTNETGGLIIEDDYNGELRFSSRPVPALHSYGGSDSVIYLGSFSKVLMPSVRVSYMILPDRLMHSYTERRFEYNQTSSKIEQLALSNYMQSGELERQLRRLRKLYSSKCQSLCLALERYLAPKRININETALSVTCLLTGTVEADKIKARAEENGVGLECKNAENGVVLKLSYSGIAAEDIESAVKLISLLVENKDS